MNRATVHLSRAPRIGAGDITLVFFPEFQLKADSYTFSIELEGQPAPGRLPDRD